MSHFVYKRQAVDDLVPGMVLGKMLVTSDGKNFLNEGAVINLRVIQTLQMWGFTQVEIREEIFDERTDNRDEVQREAYEEDSAADEPNADEITAATIQSIVESPEAPVEEDFPIDVPAGFSEHYQAAVQIVKNSLTRARFLKDHFSVNEIKKMVHDCILPLVQEPSVLDSLQVMPHDEDYLYHHSVDVGVISGTLALWIKRPFHEIEEIILGGLLHDVGKALIPLKVLNKPGALTEEELTLVKFHSIRGYKFLKESSDLSRNILLCALQHHERMDGTGYPLAVNGDKIHPYAKIVAIADVFDAMTSLRGYGRRVTPYEAVEILKHEMYGKLDVAVSAIFLEKVCQRFLGDIVQLSNGMRGEVVFLNPVDTTRPTVRTREGELIDLDKRRDVSICKMLHS